MKEEINSWSLMELQGENVKLKEMISTLEREQEDLLQIHDELVLTHQELLDEYEDLTRKYQAVARLLKEFL